MNVQKLILILSLKNNFECLTVEEDLETIMAEWNNCYFNLKCITVKPVCLMHLRFLLIKVFEKLPYFESYVF